MGLNVTHLGELVGVLLGEECEELLHHVRVLVLGRGAVAVQHHRHLTHT